MDAPIFDHPLVFDPRDILKTDGIGRVVSGSVEFNKFGEGVEIQGDIEVDAVVINSQNSEYWLSLSYKTQQVLTCSRSLDKFAKPVQSEFVLKILMSEEVKSWEFLADQEEEPCLKVNQLAKYFSVFEPVREDLILNEPMNPVKNPEEDFQWNDPSVKEEKMDPRWAKLLELRNKLDKE